MGEGERKKEKRVEGRREEGGYRRADSKQGVKATILYKAILQLYTSTLPAKKKHTVFLCTLYMSIVAYNTIIRSVLPTSKE